MNVEQRQAAADPRPSQTSLTVSPPIKLARIYTHNRRLLWAPAQRKRATMLYFANVYFLFIYFMAALFSGPGERRFAKVLHVVDLECH